MVPFHCKSKQCTNDFLRNSYLLMYIYTFYSGLISSTFSEHKHSQTMPILLRRYVRDFTKRRKLADAIFVKLLLWTVTFDYIFDKNVFFFLQWHEQQRLPISPHWSISQPFITDVVESRFEWNTVHSRNGLRKL